MNFDCTYIVKINEEINTEFLSVPLNAELIVVANDENTWQLLDDDHIKIEKNICSIIYTPDEIKESELLQLKIKRQVFNNIYYSGYTGNTGYTG